MTEQQRTRLLLAAREEHVSLLRRRLVYLEQGTRCISTEIRISHLEKTVFPLLTGTAQLP